MNTPLDRAEKIIEQFRLLSYEKDGYGTPVANPRNNEAKADIAAYLVHYQSLLGLPKTLWMSEDEYEGWLERHHR